MNSKKVSAAEALEKLKRYCAYQERCHQEVRTRLASLPITRDEKESIITTLILDGYLNEERFAKAFAGGKFRMKKWGRLKIVDALNARGLSGNCIKIGLREIAADDYESTLEKILAEKASMIDAENLFVKNDRLSKYAINKGYEPDLVWEKLRKLFPHK